MNEENVRGVCVCVHTHIHSMEDYSAIKREIMPFVTTQMDPEDIMLTEIIQKEKNKYYMISLTCGI